MEKETQKKILAGAMGALLLAGGALAGATLFPQKEVITVTEIEQMPVEVIKEVMVEVPVEIEKLVETQVEVEVQDTELTKLLCEKLTYDDMKECIEEVEAEDAALDLALAMFEDESDIFDLLEDEGIISDEDEASIVKIYKDFEDIEVSESDFDDEQYEFKITAKIEDEDDDVKKKVEFTIEVEDGEAEITDVKEL